MQSRVRKSEKKTVKQGAYAPGYPCYRQLFQPRKFSLLLLLRGMEKKREKGGRDFKIRKVFHYGFRSSIVQVVVLQPPFIESGIADVSWAKLDGNPLVENWELLVRDSFFFFTWNCLNIVDHESTMDGWVTELSMIELNHACPTPRCVWKRLVIDVGNGLDRSRNDGGGDRFGMALVKRPVYIYCIILLRFIALQRMILVNIFFGISFFFMTRKIDQEFLLYSSFSVLLI